jgi:hypothetical protein
MRSQTKKEKMKTMTKEFEYIQALMCPITGRVWLNTHLGDVPEAWCDLNDMGQVGWELITVVAYDPDTDMGTGMFKREKEAVALGWDLYQKPAVQATPLPLGLATPATEKPQGWQEEDGQDVPIPSRFPDHLSADGTATYKLGPGVRLVVTPNGTKTLLKLVNTTPPEATPATEKPQEGQK